MGMADGYAQVTGGPAAVNVHVQPGLANAMSGILNAARCRLPVIVTVGQQVQSLLAEEPFLGGELVALAAPLAKGAWEVADASSLPAAFAHAVHVACTPPRAGGAVAAARRAGGPRAAAPCRRTRPAAPRPSGRRDGPRGRPARRRTCARRSSPATRCAERSRRRPSSRWPSGSRRRSSGSRWPPRCPCRPTTRSGAAPCLRSRRRSARCWRGTTWCWRSACRCSASSAPAPARRCRTAPP